MDKKYQDISILNKNFKQIKLAIPRESRILSIFFNNNFIEIHYMDSNEQYHNTLITYEDLSNGSKIIID